MASARSDSVVATRFAAEASRAIRQAEVGAAKTMIERTEQRFDLKPERLAADTAYGSGANLNWLVNDKKIAPHIPVIAVRSSCPVDRRDARTGIVRLRQQLSDRREVWCD